MAQDAVVFVNVIEVDADRLDEVVAILRDGLDTVIGHRPGFISAEVLVDSTRTRVINVARWRSAEDASKTQQDGEAAAYATRLREVADSVRPGLFHAVARVEVGK